MYVCVCRNTNLEGLAHIYVCKIVKSISITDYLANLKGLPNNAKKN